MITLNKEQEQVLNCGDPKIIINASAGTGKTSVLVEMANRNKDKNVVMITFTNRAAEEMVARLDFTPYFIGTIHAFALHQLRIIAQQNGFRIRLINKDTIRKIIKLIFKENDFGVHVTKRLKDDAFLAVTNQEFEFDGLRRKVIMKVKDEYNKYKEQNKVYDLTDAPDYLLEKLNDLNITLNNELVLVDEAQDLNMSQYELIQKLGNNIVAIGDPKQSIYLFRGASPDVFNRFEEEGYTPFTLTQNYRSKQEIIDFAKADLICERGYGGEIINDTSIFKYGPQVLCRRNEQVKEIEKYYPSVMTIHAAKGLEFDSVCLVNFDEESSEDINVKFVAQTRARDRLATLSYYDVVNFISRF